MPLDILIPADQAGRAKAGRGRHRRAGRAALQARAADRPRRRGARQLHRSRHGNRDRAAQVRPAARILEEGAVAGARDAGRSAAGGLEGPARPARSAVRHHRRRDGEGFRRRGARGARGQGFPPARGDRRREPLRAPRRRAGRGRARARHLGLFPAARDPDAAGEALQRPVLAESGRRPPGDGLRHGDHRRRARSRATSSTPRFSVRTPG